MTATQDADAFRGFHSQELRLGELNPQGWTLEEIFVLDGKQDGYAEETELSLPSASGLWPESCGEQLESDSDAAGSETV